MISFYINDQAKNFTGGKESSLLDYLRKEAGLFSARDGCSGEGVCGACTVEVNSQAKLACRVKMKDLNNARIYTLEGLPDAFRKFIADAFAQKGAVQCGFCTPGFIMRTRSLFQEGSLPNRQKIIQHIRPNLCRCTGYIKIVDALEYALTEYQNDGLKNKNEGFRPKSGARIGDPYPKFQALDAAMGTQRFTDDMVFEGMLHAALHFSSHPRAIVQSICTSQAKDSPGVVGVFTASDIPGEKVVGLIEKDWPMMVAPGEWVHCIGDVVAGVVATSEEAARQAAEKIEVTYDVRQPITSAIKAMQPDSENVHPHRSNILETCSIQHGDVEMAFREAAHVASGIFETQRIEHAFLETETAIALPQGDGVRVYSQGQGVYVDQKQIAEILGIDKQKVRVTQVPNGGGFGGKEDLTVQGHAALYAFLLQKPVKLHLNRQESIRMHPKRHPVWMDMELACDGLGRLTAIRLKAVGDTGAYASVGAKVMERVVGHATGGYHIPSVDIRADTVYTNNIPSGAMRGFGVPQVVFALESCLEDLCDQGGFDRWQMRYDNALKEGSKTATGQKLQGVGLRRTLLAVKEAFRGAKYAGIACGIKNTGVGNGMVDESQVVIDVVDSQHVVIQHGWTEMGQGVHTMAIQTLHQETGIDPAIIAVITDTKANIPTGMTTSSRATALVGNAIIDAARHLKADLKKHKTLQALSGRTYRGKTVCDWTSKPGADQTDPKIHFAYGYATQVVELNNSGKIVKVVAAHDGGRIMNRMLFEGQIEGAVHMGLGYALTENLKMKDGFPLSFKFKDLKILRAHEMPTVEVIGIETKDAFGPYGAKGIGEIGMVPTAAAVSNAYRAFDGQKRVRLPLQPPLAKNV